MVDQYYVLKMNNMTEEESLELLDLAFKDVKWGEGMSVELSHLTDKGVAKLKETITGGDF